MTLLNKFALFQTGISLSSKLTDCIDDSAIDTADFNTVKIILYKPDGTRIDLAATLVDDPDNTGEKFITYTENTTGGSFVSILDITGYYEYTGYVKKNDNAEFESPNRTGFWVT